MRTDADADRRQALAPPAVALLLVNLLPLVGVLAWGWSAFEVVALYWFENLVIGVACILRMLVVGGLGNRPVSPPSGAGDSDEKAGEESGLWVMKGILIPFFVIHYGLFCLVHGMFILLLLAPDDVGRRIGGIFSGMARLAGTVLEGEALIAVLALAASHGLSFAYNYIGRGEYRRVQVDALFHGPYPRVVLLHVTILIGGVASKILGEPAVALALLVAGKTVMDWRLHVREHRRAGAARSAPATRTAQVTRTEPVD